MSYLAIARKWRPREFDDLVGQSHVVQTLKNAITHDRVAHAYLFSGPRGIGKTSVARIFAKALRCPNNEQPESDMIAEGRSLDVVEIDGASNNGVEAVREIRENVAYGASTGKYKIYIIDEVHMLSISAFNALLKTLEEPPPHVIFIFATTEVQKIPMTILSRCQRFEFRRLTSSQITGCLKKILDSEGVTIAEEGLQVIASHSDGALRDAQSLLDQVLSAFSGDNTTSLDEKQVVEALGVSSTNATREWLEHILNKNIPETIKLIEQIYFTGVDLKHFAERSLEEVRRLYLMILAKEGKHEISAGDLDISTSHFSELEKLSSGTSLIQVERMAQILTRSISQLSWASLPRFVLEMSAVRMANLDALSKVESALKEAPAPQPQPSAPTPNRPSVSPPGPVPTAPASAPRSVPVPSGQPNWKGFVDTVMKKRPLLGALLSHADFKIDETGGNKKILLSFGSGSFYEKQATESKNLADIETAVKEYFGTKTLVDISNVTENTNASLEKVKQEETAALKKKALEHPSVLQAKEMLGAEVVGVNIEN